MIKDISIITTGLASGLALSHNSLLNHSIRISLLVRTVKNDALSQFVILHFDQGDPREFVCPGEGFYPSDVLCSSNYYYCNADGVPYQQVHKLIDILFLLTFFELRSIFFCYQHADLRNFLLLRHVHKAMYMIRIAKNVCLQKIVLPVIIQGFKMYIVLQTDTLSFSEPPTTTPAAFICPGEGFYPTDEQCSPNYYYCNATGGLYPQVRIYILK